MKIINLRFKNLNSLAGEWSIDFSAPEYTCDGIFAISGPTGAGKSTILDAICLALYGCTPRLENLSGTSNEIMSRQTGECFAEVVFETMEGRFRSNWSQRRARLNSEGLLQNPRHEIAEAISGKILASQLKSTREMVEKKSGMDFKRFTQSMMLAQGGFAAFLQAKGSERAPILEQITGTEIYSKISVHVFERQKKERELLENLKAENSGIILLTPEEEQEQGLLLEERNAKIISLNTLKDQLVTARTWIENIDRLKSELLTIAQEDLLLTNRLNEFSGKRGILRDAVRAANLDGDYASLVALRKQQTEENGMLVSLQSQTSGLQAAITAETAAFEIVKKNNSDIINSNAVLLELIKRVRLLDQEIRQKSTSVEDITKEIRRLKSESETENARIETFKSAIKDLTDKNESAKRYLEENSSDAVLVSELAVIKVKASGLLDLRNSLLSAERKVDASNKSLKAQIEEISRLSEEIVIAIEKNIADKNAIDLVQSEINKSLDGKLPADLYAKRDHLILHLADLRKISDLGEERSKLEDGKACPLCGSLSHPFAAGNVPAISDAELEYSSLIGLLKSLETLNQKVADLQAVERLTAEKILNLKNKSNICLQQKLIIAESIEKGTGEMEACQANLKERSADLLRMLVPLDLDEVPGTVAGIKVLLDSFEVRKNKWQQQEKLKKETEDTIIAKQNEINIIAAVIKTKRETSDAKEIELSSAEKSLSSVHGLRAELFGDRNADEEEQKSGKLLAEANEKLKKSEERLQEIIQKLKDNMERIGDLQNKIKTRGEELFLKGKSFTALLVKDGFADEKDYLSKKLPVNDREKLEAEANALDKKRTELDTRKKEREQKLELEGTKNLTAEKPEFLSVQLSETTEALTAMLQEVGALKQRLLANNEAKVKGEALAFRINIQNQVFNRWVGLSSLIGSADGKKYRNFAQSLTLEIMVSYANNQLVKLSDRYLLTRDKDEPLELNVIDNYQAGEIRSTKNLSGGESFIVSLALALGLSRMSSRNVRVDSLFLDEGFGTLDEDSLETALTTLAGLRQDGKMIGVISHVGAMKDRINTKITVTPLREGRSVITGPGCSGV